MCVDKHRFKCCGCSLTSGTIAVGVFQAIGAIPYAVLGYMPFYVNLDWLWIEFSFSAVLALIPLMILCVPNNAQSRMAIYYVYLFISILRPLSVIMILIGMFTTSSSITEDCNYGYYPDPYHNNYDYECLTYY